MTSSPGTVLRKMLVISPEQLERMKGEALKTMKKDLELQMQNSLQKSENLHSVDAVYKEWDKYRGLLQKFIDVKREEEKKSVNLPIYEVSSATGESTGQEESKKILKLLEQYNQEDGGSRRGVKFEIPEPPHTPRAAVSPLHAAPLTAKHESPPALPRSTVPRDQHGESAQQSRPADGAAGVSPPLSSPQAPASAPAWAPAPAPALTTPRRARGVTSPLNFSAEQGGAYGGYDYEPRAAADMSMRYLRGVPAYPQTFLPSYNYDSDAIPRAIEIGEGPGGGEKDDLDDLSLEEMLDIIGSHVNDHDYDEAMKHESDNQRDIALDSDGDSDEYYSDRKLLPASTPTEPSSAILAPVTTSTPHSPPRVRELRYGRVVRWSPIQPGRRGPPRSAPGSRRPRKDSSAQ